VERKRGRPTGEERRQRLEEILDAAVRLFLEQGFGRTTLDQIATAAQVTKRTIYAYLGDKTEVFNAVVRRLNEQVVTVPDPVPGDASAELAAVCRRLVSVLHSDQAVGLHRLVVAEARQFPELAEGFYANGPRRYTGDLARLLRASGAVSASRAGTAAEQLFALLLGEPHRRRLLGLQPAPTARQSAAHAASALAALGLTARDVRR
jgi:TetR/AcrR family transcriptional regulator, mexJK operon transcriptional repressor